MTRCRRQKQLPKLEYEFLPEHALRTDAHLQRYAEQIRTRGLSHRGGTRNHLNQSGMVFNISPAVLYAGIGTPTGPGFIGTSPHRLRGSPGMTPIRWAPVYLLFGLTSSGVR